VGISAKCIKVTSDLQNIFQNRIHSQDPLSVLLNRPRTWHFLDRSKRRSNSTKNFLKTKIYSTSTDSSIWKSKRSRGKLRYSWCENHQESKDLAEGVKARIQEGPEIANGELFLN